jgi:hypothetical protein
MIRHYPCNYAQPPHELNVHPNSAAAQLGLTPQEIRVSLAEQERWFGEEYQQLEEDRTWVSTEHQEQAQHQDDARWASIPDNANDTANDDDTHVVSLGCHNKFDEGTGRIWHEDSTEPFACGFGIQDNTYGDWAEKVEEQVDYTVQGEYIPANYSPTPDPPSSTSWHPPSPPTLLYTPSRPHYKPSYG